MTLPVKARKVKGLAGDVVFSGWEICRSAWRVVRRSTKLKLSRFHAVGLDCIRAGIHSIGWTGGWR